MSNYSSNNNSNSNRYQSYGSGGYRNWKQTGSTSAAPPKEKQLTANDFPALPTNSTPKAKTVWEKPENSFVDRVKDMITKEEQQKYLNETKKEDEKLDIIPLSSWIHKKSLAQKQEKMERQARAEDEEREYRYQISHEVDPDDDQF